MVATSLDARASCDSAKLIGRRTIQVADVIKERYSVMVRDLRQTDCDISAPLSRRGVIDATVA